MTDEINISARADGLDVSSKGEGTSRLVNAICDLGSPFSEGAGLIGDMVRTYRQERAVLALARVKSIADSKQEQLTPPAPKFMLDWLEAVSLEEDDELVEMWANLFVANAVSDRRAHYLFKRILRELSPHEAAILRRLVEKGRSQTTYLYADVAEDHWKDLDSPKYRDGLHAYKGSVADEDSFLNFVFEVIERPGVKAEVISAHYFDGEDATWGLEEVFNTGQIRSFLHSAEDYDSLDMLQSLGLIGRGTKSLVRVAAEDASGENLVAEIAGTYLKPLGCLFLETVDPRSWSGNV